MEKDSEKQDTLEHPEHNYYQIILTLSKFLLFGIETDAIALHLDSPKPPNLKTSKPFLYDKADINSVESFIEKKLDTNKTIILLLSEVFSKNAEIYQCPIAYDFHPIIMALDGMLSESKHRTTELLHSLQFEKSRKAVEKLATEELGIKVKISKGKSSYKGREVSSPIEFSFFDIQKIYVVQLNYFLKDLYVLVAKTKIKLKSYAEGDRYGLKWPDDKEKIFEEIMSSQSKGKKKSGALRGVLAEHSNLSMKDFDKIRVAFNRYCEKYR